MLIGSFGFRGKQKSGLIGFLSRKDPYKAKLRAVGQLREFGML